MTTPEHPEPDEPLGTLVAATIFLMSSYVRDGGSPRLAAVVTRHLEALAERRDVPGVLGATCEQAADHWAQLGIGAAPAPAPARPRRPAWLRLVTG